MLFRQRRAMLPLRLRQRFRCHDDYAMPRVIDFRQLTLR